MELEQSTGPGPPESPAVDRLDVDLRRWLAVRWMTTDPLPHPEDRALLRAVKAGDRAAAARLADRLACIPAMLRIRERRVGVALTKEEREEIVQETLTALWSKLGHYTGHRPIEAWVWGFALRQHYKALRKRQNQRAVNIDDQPIAINDPEPPSPAIWERVRVQVENLGRPDSRIVHLRHFEAVSFPEIALELRLPVNTIKTRYYRALVRLRVSLLPMWREIAE